MHTRRGFGKLAVAGLPLALATSRMSSGAVTSSSGGVVFGVATTSFRDLPRVPSRDNVDQVISALLATGVKEIELSSINTEAPPPAPGLPPPPPPGAYGGPIAAVSPADIAIRTKAVRDTLRNWRLNTPASWHSAIKAKFDAAGIAIYAYRVDYDPAFTDEEIAATFQQAKALGVSIVSSLTSLDMARRLAPFAEKNRILLSLRNGSPQDSASGMTRAEDLAQALSLSKSFRVNLDLGDFTAANQQAVAYVQESHASITHVLLKDRTRNGGGNEQFGEGDTPIKEVVRVLNEKRYPIPAFVDFQYVGLGKPVDEIKRSLAYATAAIA